MLARNGRFSYEPALRLARNGQIETVLVSYRVDTIPGMRAILAERYREVYRTRGLVELNPWLLYVRRKAGD